MTFGELEQLAQCVAANLLRHGYSASRPVALYMSNCVEMVVLHLAVWRLGGTVASINAMLLPGKRHVHIAAATEIHHRNCYPHVVR